MTLRTNHEDLHMRRHPAPLAIDLRDLDDRSGVGTTLDTAALSTSSRTNCDVRILIAAAHAASFRGAILREVAALGLDASIVDVVGDLRGHGDTSLLTVGVTIKVPGLVHDATRDVVARALLGSSLRHRTDALDLCVDVLTTTAA